MKIILVIIALILLYAICKNLPIKSLNKIEHIYNIKNESEAIRVSKIYKLKRDYITPAQFDNLNEIRMDTIYVVTR